jgi:hypothetical protein
MKKCRKTNHKARRGMAIETAIYTMVIVFMLISTIMFVTVEAVRDDIKNNSAFLERYAEIDLIGEDFVASVLNDREFSPESYTGFQVEVVTESNTLTLTVRENGKTVLTVAISGGKIVCWTH